MKFYAVSSCFSLNKKPDLAFLTASRLTTLFVISGKFFNFASHMPNQAESIMKPFFHKHSGNNLTSLCCRLCALLIAAVIVISGFTGMAAPQPGTVKAISTAIARDKRSLCALRDRYGFIWVGTLTGLCCYDSNGQPLYDGINSMLPDSEGISVSALFEKDDDIWFGGNQGLYIFSRDANRMHRFDARTEYGVVISSPVQKIASDHDGHLWILTLGQGLFIYDTASGSLVQNSRHGAFFSDIAVAPDGTVCCITHDGYFIVFNTDGAVMRKLRLPDFTTDKNPIVMTNDGGKIRICANHSLYGYLPGDDKAVKEKAFSTPSVVNTIIARPDHSLWIGSDEGIFCLGANSAQPVPVPLTSKTASGIILPSLHDSRVAQLTEDPEGGMIVVTHTGIIFLTDRLSAVNQINAAQPGNPLGMVNVLCHDASGDRIWIGTDHGVSSYDVSAATISPVRLPLGTDIVVTSLAQNNGSLWIGSSHHGLFRYDEASGKVRKYTYDEATPYAVTSNCINYIYCASTGETFILTSWGLCRYNPATDNFSSLLEMESGTPFSMMQEDNRGRIWAFTQNNTIYRRDIPNSRFYPFRSASLNGVSVTLLHRDMKGGLWAVASGNRLMHYDDQTDDFINYPIPLVTGHPIKFIEDDGNGNLWIATDERIVRYDPESATTDRNFLSDCQGANIGAVATLPDRSVLFGTSEGLSTFSPSMASSRPDTPQVFFLSMDFPYLDDSHAELERLGLDRLLYTVEDISLPYADNTFTISFAATAANDVPGVRYQYRIDGTNKAWLAATGNKATFTDLSPGTYPLLLRPESGDEKDIKRLNIRILPPWYLSWQAWLAYTVMIVLIIWAGFLYGRRRMRRKTEEKILAMQVEKERENYESKMRFFVNLVHEIRTPLTLINLPLEQLAAPSDTEKMTDAEKQRLVKAMRRNLDYLLGIINQLLDFRKAEQDTEVCLALSPVDLSAQIRTICKRFEEPMASKGKTLSVDVPDEPLEAVADSSKFDRVVMNLMGNALKYCKSKVDVTLRKESDGIILLIADDGPGIDEKEREHIFDTYYQIAGDSTGANLGTGLGLAYARLIARAHGGDITVTENPGGGACFRLRIPAPLASKTPDQSDSSQAETNVAKKEITILFVEDNDELRLSVAEALAPDYSVLPAADATEALGILEDNRDIDLIVSDFMMPGIDGAEFCRRVKGNVATSYIPFIMLTAKTGREAKEEAMEAGADAFVEKPFSIKQLKAQIANIIHTRELFHARMKSSTPVTESVPEEAPFINKMDAEFLRDLNQSIEENIFDDAFSIDSMADRMNMSRSTFYRRMKAITGLTPVDYLKNFRLDHAARLLDEGMRISEVYVAVGFSSSSYFAKCFKAKFGYLPKEYVSRPK